MDKKAYNLYNLRISRLEYGSAKVMAETPGQAKDMVQELIKAGMVDWFDYEVTDIVAESIDIKENQRKAEDDRTYTVTEVCPHCESEIEMRWDTDTQGFKAFCPVCGNRLMLCDECLHAEDNKGGGCDFDSEKDGCWRNLPEPPSLDSTGESEFDYILAYIREGSFEGLEEIERLRALWTAYCLRKGLTTDKDAYVAKVRKLWHSLQKNGTSEFSGDDYGRFEYIMGGLL